MVKIAYHPCYAHSLPEGHRFPMLKFILTFLICSISLMLSAQFSISGKVIDSITKQPLAGINLFLNHSSIGTNSNANGEFILEHIPQGKFELIISSFNYETQVITITSTQVNKIFRILLKPSAQELQEVIVQPYDEDGWDRWGKYFNTHFLGSSSLIKQCILVNPDVVKFKYVRKNNMVRAFSNERLIFENRALGYRIKYLLSKFEFYLSENSFAFSGYPLFEKLVPKNIEEENTWLKNREEAYKGSILHFFRSLYQDKLVEEGFEIKQMFKVNDQEIQRATKLYKTISKANKDSISIPIHPDSLDYYQKASRLNKNEYSIILNTLLTKNDLVAPVDSAIDFNAQNFRFNEWLHIEYTKKKEPYEYSKLFFRRANQEYIATDINLTYQKGVSIYPNGTFFKGDNIFFDGYWAWWEKISTHLPVDYYPNLKK